MSKAASFGGGWGRLPEILPVHGLAVGKLRVHERIQQVIGQAGGRAECDVVGDAAARAVLFHAVFVVPVGQEKRQLRAFVRKNHLLIVFQVAFDPAFPHLPEKDEIQLHVDFTARLVAVVAQQTRGREGRRDFFQQFLVEILLHVGKIGFHIGGYCDTHLGFLALDDFDGGEVGVRPNFGKVWNFAKDAPVIDR